MAKISGAVDVTAFTTDAKFRAWGLACSTALAAAGFVQTADTGQINWVTVLKPVATNTKAGYEIWRFNDTLQATAPIFIRVDYGSSGTASGNGPGTWLTVGTSTNGAGTITGVNIGTPGTGIQATNVVDTVNNPAMTYLFSHSAANGFGLMCFGLGTSAGPGNSTPGTWAIERTKDANGNPTGAGMSLHFTYNSTTGFRQRSINFSTATAYNADVPVRCGFLTTSSTSLATVNVIPLYPHYVAAGDVYRLSGSLGFTSGDIPLGTTFTTTILGVSRMFYSINYGATVRYADSSNSSSSAIAFMWEN